MFIFLAHHLLPSFVSLVPDEGVEGWLIHANPHDACDSLDPPPEPPSYKRKSILLARRYNCTFTEKAIFAQKAGESSYEVAYDYIAW